MAQSTRTIDHDQIREWIEERGGMPAVVASTKSDGAGVLRVDFGEQDENLEQVPWEEFFRIFDLNDLAFLYQEEAGGGEESYFCKFVARNENEEEETSDSGLIDDSAEAD